MKKYMTVAALLAAGTAFANAVDTSAWETVDFTLVGNNGTNVTDDAVTGGRAAFATLNGLTGTFEGYSWELSFTVDTVRTVEQIHQNNANRDVDQVFSSRGTGSGSGYSITAVKDGEDNVFALNLNGSAIEGKSISTTESALTLVWDAVSNQLSLSVGGQTVSVDNANSSVLSLTTMVSSEISAQGVGGATLGPVFWTNGGANPLSGISLKTNTTIIPEPSAFGLLAGVGALALVASRRRRTK